MAGGTGCLTAVGWTAEAFGIKDSSSIFNDAANNARFFGTSVNVGQLLPPELPELDLGASISGIFEAALQDPGYSALAPPTASFEAPSLEQVAYDAVLSVIDLGHESETILDISYPTGLDQIDPPTGTPPAVPLNYPQSAALNLPSAPIFSILSAPDFSVVGNKPDMRSIYFTPYVWSGLQPLVLGDLPAYEPPDVEALQWQEELTYDDDLDLRETLEQLMSGGGEAARWIDGFVQERLHRSDTRTFDLESKRAIDQVMSAFASRNFSLPSGAAEKAVMAVAGQELEKSYEVSQKIRDEVYEGAMTAVTTAVQQSMKVERYHFQLYIRYVRQNLKVYQLNLQLASDAYNALADVTNTIIRAARAKVDAYNQYIAAVSDENAAAAAQTLFLDARVETFLARLRMYDADVSLLQKATQVRSADIRNQTLILDEYRALLQGILANAEIAQQNVSAFQRAIRAHSQSLQWQDDVLEGFDSAVGAAASKIELNDAKFSAYRQLWGAERTRAGAYQTYVSASTSVLNEEIQRFRRASESQRNYLSSIASSVNQSFAAAGAFSEASLDTARHAGAFNSAKISYTTALNSNSLTTETIDTTVEALAAEAVVQQAKLDAAQESAKVTAAGALAQASSTIFGVNVSAQGRTDENVSGRASGRTSFRGARSRSYSEQCIEDISQSN